MIEKALRKQLRPILNRRRRLYLAQRLSVCWFISAIIGLGLVSANQLWGWHSSFAGWTFCISTILATVIILYKYSKMQPDYHAVARNIEQQHPDMQALLLAAIEQEPQGLGGRLDYLQERVIGDALRHAGKHDWLQSISTKRLFLAYFSEVAAFLFILIMLLQLLPSTPSLFTINRRVKADKGYNVTVSPGDTTVELGAAVVIIARFEGRVPPEAVLWTGTSDEDKKRIVLTKNLDDPVFGGVIPEVNNNLLYHIEYADRRTSDFKIGVLEHPALQKADAKIIYPSYTKLPERVIKNTRQISVVEDSEVILTFTLNKPVATAKLVSKNNSTINLEIDNINPNTYNTTVTATKNERYELHLRDVQGLRNKVPPRFTIDVNKNLPPELIPLFPNRDVIASPLEELSLEAEVSDDYGLTGYGLSYTLAGVQSKDITLSQSVIPNENLQIKHLLALEDINTQPDQLLTYFFWADDTGPDGRTRRTSSDIYFAEIRHFDEIFHESQSLPQQDNQNQEQSGGQQRQQNEQLAQLQKQIISATWNVKKQAEQSGGVDEHKEDLGVIRQSQTDALQRAQSVMTQAEDQETVNTLREAAKHMESSLEHLTNADESSSMNELTSALAFEQLAYQELLKLKDLEHQVARGSNTGAGSNARSGGSGQSEQQLQQLEMTQREKRYETQRLAQAQQRTQREDLQVLNRLRELARRQKEMSQRLKEAQTALQQAESEQEKQEIRQRLKRLREQQLLALQDVDELQRRMEEAQNRQRMAGERQQLDQSRSRIQQSSEELEQEMLSNAITSTTRAQRELEQMRDDFRQRTSGQFTERMQNMRDDARDIDRQQKEIAEDINNQINSERKTLTDPGLNRELVDRINRQRESTEDLLRQMREVSEQAETSEPLLSRKLYDTLRKASTNNLDRSLEATGELLKRNFLPQAQQIEKQAGKGIEDIRKGVEEAAENVLGHEAESLRMARQQLDELIRQINDEAARFADKDRRLLTDSNELAESAPARQRPPDARTVTDNDGQPRESSQQTQGGGMSANADRGGNQPNSDPNRSSQQDSQRTGSERQTANARTGKRENPDGWGDNMPGQRDANDPNGLFTGRDFDQWSDQLRDVEEMLTEREFRDEAARIRDRARSILAEFVRHGKSPQWNLVRQQITNPLTELRKNLSDKLAQVRSDEALVPIDRDPVPGRFAELVRKYYENLGGGD
ncbi:MAG: hypothetical protein JW837_01260 [Sedimentisphaerales bacterium]|nr:hypothetical protein [Sedimentisphaerales bacterium]